VNSTTSNLINTARYEGLQQKFVNVTSSIVKINTILLFLIFQQYCYVTTTHHIHFV